MHSLLESVAKGREILLVVAAPIEAMAVFRGLGAISTSGPAGVGRLWERVRVVDGIDLVLMGVGKANAAGAVAHCVRPSDGLILNLGIAGALPGAGKSFALHAGDTVVASHCVFADEGLMTDQGFADLGSIGFPIDPVLGSTFACDGRLVEAFGAGSISTGTIATVSTCSATDALAQAIAARTDGVAESMEGAACALVAHRLEIPFCEIRAISNYTGSRSSQQWNIKQALSALESLVASVMLA